MFDTSKTTTSFGTRLRAAREKIGLPQDQLGLTLGVSKSTVSAWELGRDAPSFSRLPDIKNALKVSLDDLICGDPRHQPWQPQALYVAEPQAPYKVGTHASSPAEVALLKRFRALSKTKQSALLELID